MSLSIVHTRAALGVNAPPITIEVHISNGLPGLTMVGLPETTVKERATGYAVQSLIADMNFRLKR
ncbi:putative ATP-dependent protease [Salmonella enterica subsp. arizonae]|uniref:Putative ATP-dependent protease n=1 Tax=Salmonella enterica subsp. arizonae TaxID=59203 RepID=A0A379SE58_SALER|nr:putative ATP-dependent protease [Salmonella enterica subsp. arizonae]